jgi:hypothetical protein
MLIPTGAAEFSGVVKGNRTFGIILAYLKEETTEEQIVDAMKNRFNVSEDIIRRDVDRTIAELLSFQSVRICHFIWPPARGQNFSGKPHIQRQILVLFYRFTQHPTLSTTGKVR